ncbi:FprA family A-type flavoprotein [Coprobacter fastidiosus]|uniref:Flavorubredoxin n=1 Tax=Coprobacter fastidiosus NSB1 = JCM 33896 TaxID=1349822 RepID=A0A495WI93_9BACT|nr:FprA family A-type flavoprotein [Coprobacter fastidiosus]ERM89661.1 flavodoxin [Coprobacter fastidiosus NSB1 = JCM 33896]RKT61256.1 flavorubredoxin [Coprobacter fastidiosus NSB1 = JCM 33896]BEG61327.1 FprA family A-type flavoprotein [Coprobacter fastidiosus]
MSTITEISRNIHYVGVNDRTKHLFEGLWPLPLGVSYNSYLIVDKSVVLIDTVDHCYTDLFFEKIKNILGERPIDYLVVNHMEPDHSASINDLCRVYPDIKIIGNSKTIGMIEGFYGIFDKFHEVKDGDRLPLGEKVLTFYMTPMVHWPETMMTYCEDDKILFSGDAFGCFGTLDGGIIDYQMNTEKYWDEMFRYYSNIVGKYGAPVQKALAKLSGIDIQIICSTHGPIWKEEIQKVISIYNKLSLYEGEEGVVIAYGSMYGNTEKMAEVIARELAAQGIKNIVMHNVSKSDMSYILRDIFKYKGLIIGSPTYTNELFPNIESLVSKLESRDMKNRVFGYFGSFSWAGAAVKRLSSFAERMKWDVTENPVEMKQGITSEKIAQCQELAKAIATKLKQ